MLKVRLHHRLHHNHLPADGPQAQTRPGTCLRTPELVLSSLALKLALRIACCRSVGWTIMANHGGGYAYRLAPATQPLTEQTFRKLPLDFVGKSILRWDGDVSTQHEFTGWRVSTGTVPPGSTWTKNPVPSGLWEREGATFQPVCEESHACRRFLSGFGGDQGVCRCSGYSNGGPLLPNLQVVDRVHIPHTLSPGRYVLQWRWDCEESDQVWASCADVTIVR